MICLNLEATIELCIIRYFTLALAARTQVNLKSSKQTLNTDIRFLLGLFRQNDLISAECSAHFIVKWKRTDIQTDAKY